MTHGPVDLRLGLEIVALVSSTVPLALAVRTMLNAHKKIYERGDGSRVDLNKSARAVTAFHSGIEGLHTRADTLLDRARLSGAAIEAARAKRQKTRLKPAAPVDLRYAEFLSLLDEWSRSSSLRLPGAAAARREEIANLAHSSMPFPNAASKETFARCANSLVEYLVEATDTKFKQAAPEAVEAALTGMVNLAGRELIRPESGAAWEPSLHEVVDKVARGANRAGTIAIVSTRGLRGGLWKTMKARVFLYDD